MLLIGFHDYPAADVYFFAAERGLFLTPPYCRAYLYNFEHGKRATQYNSNPSRGHSPNNMFFFQWLDIFVATTGLHQRANHALSAVLLAIHEPAASTKSTVEISSTMSSAFCFDLIILSQPITTIYSNCHNPTHVLYAPPPPYLNYKNKLPDFILLAVEQQLVSSTNKGVDFYTLRPIVRQVPNREHCISYLISND